MAVTQGNRPVQLPRFCSSVAAMAEFLVSSAQLRGAQQWAGAPGVLQDPSPDMTGVSPVHAAPGWIPSNLGYLLFLEILEATN